MLFRSGRGFLFGQVRGIDGKLYDLGTKGTGPTPYSRGGDGRLTLKGGVREVLAAEMLHRMGVRTSRCLSLVETGEGLYRGDEPSPTRSSVMIRVQESHIRFGTFERLDFLGRRDLIARLLDHVIEVYYPHDKTPPPSTAPPTLPLAPSIPHKTLHTDRPQQLNADNTPQSHGPTIAQSNLAVLKSPTVQTYQI